MTTIPVRPHVRRKPSKPPAYLAKHAQLRADVEAMKRGELSEYRTPSLFRWIADGIRSLGKV
jgi:hypothetical protein